MSKTQQDTPLLAFCFPGATITELEQIFAGRANRALISNWRSGTRSVPQWARDIIDSHLAAKQAALNAEIQARRDRAKEKAPGKKAGAQNLFRWRGRTTAK